MKILPILVAFLMLFTNNNEKIKFILNTYGGLNYPSDTVIDGSRIQMAQLNPYPETTRVITQKEYIAELLIKKD